MPHIPMHTEAEPNFQGSLLNMSNNLNREGKISRISTIPTLFFVKENASQRVFGHQREKSSHRPAVRWKEKLAKGRGFGLVCLP